MAPNAASSRLRVIPAARRGDLVPVCAGPGDEAVDCREHAPAECGEFVVDAGRHDRMHGSGQQSVSLKLAECPGEHPLADLADVTVQFGEPAAPRAEQLDDEQGPLVG